MIENIKRLDMGEDYTFFKQGTKIGSLGFAVTGPDLGGIYHGNSQRV
jgi:hypothetical protein